MSRRLFVACVELVSRGLILIAVVAVGLVLWLWAENDGDEK